MIEKRYLVERIRAADIPSDLAPFDRAFAEVCLDLAEATYLLLPDDVSESEVDGDPAEERLTEAERHELRGMLLPPPSGGTGLAFEYDGLFLKALGYRIGHIVVVAIRGTDSLADMIVDAKAATKLVVVSSPLAPSMRWKVHRGFHGLAMEIKEPVERELANVCRLGDRIVITGHSLGGVVGLLFGASFDDSGITGVGRGHLPDRPRATLSAFRTAAHYSFGAPRPGKNVSGVGFPHHRLVAPGDWVPKLSPSHSHDVDPIPLRRSHRLTASSGLPWRQRADPLKHHRLENYRALLNSLSV